MAKVIKYKFLSCEINHGTEENPDIEQIILDKSMTWSEANEEIAKREAYNGKYTVEEVDDPDTPTLEDRVDTLEDNTADLTEALDMILSGVVE